MEKKLIEVVHNSTMNANNSLNESVDEFKSDVIPLFLSVNEISQFNVDVCQNSKSVLIQEQKVYESLNALIKMFEITGLASEMVSTSVNATHFQ
jgi:hypothetical protein